MPTLSAQIVYCFRLICRIQKNETEVPSYGVALVTVKSEEEICYGLLQGHNFLPFFVVKKPSETFYIVMAIMSTLQ